MTTTWPFADPPNVAVFVSQRILDLTEWIYYVSHHEEDGAWVFHPKSGLTPESEMKVVALKTILALDPSVAMLADLAPGWSAWREESGAEWQRTKIEIPDGG